ncbi:MAG: LysM peptidoglycan-binding domain-containing protein [Actinomycetota bacterium]|nr:LysM peptidoglycan-binding domain-containing protein [Actinomycetota bacterium]
MEPASLYLASVLGILGLWFASDGIWAVAHAFLSRPRSRRSRSTQFVAAGVGLMIALMSWRALPVAASVVPQRDRTMIEVDSVSSEADSPKTVSSAALHATPSPASALTNRSLLASDAVMVNRGTTSTNGSSHTVVSGECLWRIARSILRTSDHPITGASISAMWREIYDLNRGVIGSNPSLIFPGQVLVLPER